MKHLVFTAAMVTAACSPSPGPVVPELAQSAGQPFLFMFAADADEKDDDFLVVYDLRPDSPTLGQPIATTPVGMKASMPHHMEYVMPPEGEAIFMNAHHHEASMLVRLNGVEAPVIEKTFGPPGSLRFPHDYSRTPTGTRLVGFLRSDGKWADAAETADPGQQGGIAEYSADGMLIRSRSSAVEGISKPVRPYAFALLPELDRMVVTSALMMEDLNADVIQIYRYSDFELLHTVDVPPGALGAGTLEGSERAPFGPRVLPDGSVFFNAYGCGFYRLTDIETDKPQLANVFTLETPPIPDDIRGACGIPVRVNNLWIMPVGGMNMVLVLDITDPAAPKEVFRLKTPDHFAPHWLAKDERTNRLVLGAELGGEEGMYLLRIDTKTGALSFDPLVHDAKNGDGYLSLDREEWPHGKSGPAWAHAALFLGR